MCYNSGGLVPPKQLQSCEPQHIATLTDEITIAIVIVCYYPKTNLELKMLVTFYPVFGAFNCHPRHWQVLQDKVEKQHRWVNLALQQRLSAQAFFWSTQERSSSLDIWNWKDLLRTTRY